MNKRLDLNVCVYSRVCGAVLLGVLTALTGCGMIGLTHTEAGLPEAKVCDGTCPGQVALGRKPGQVKLGRLSARKVKLPAPNLQRTPEVERELKRMSDYDRKVIASAMEQKKEHLGAMAKVFEQEGVPVELLNVALIESGFRSDARSGAGAVGMWQFMKSTGRIYGLIINLLQDQRKDPVLSTAAAARHLKDLYVAYQDWYLALAAYNAGCGTVDRAILKSGSRDFWTLAREGHLSRETSSFVPRFIAASLVQTSMRAYGYDTRNG